MTPSVTVFGSTLVDILFELPRHYLHSHSNGSALSLPFGEKLAMSDYVWEPGGSGANVAVGLKKLGMDVSLRSNISDDAFGRYLEQSLTKMGVAVVGMSSKAPTPLSVVLRCGAERTIITAGGREYNFLGLEIPETGWIHLGPLPEKNDEFLQKLTTHRLQTNQGLSINPSMTQLEERSRVFLATLKTADVVFLNLQEALRLTRLPSRSQVIDIIRAVHALGPKTVTITDGERGGYLGKDGRIWFGEAVCDSLCRLDATGAGDAFASGLLYGLLSADERMTEEDIQERCLRAGLINSGAAVASIGAQKGLLSAKQIEQDLQTVKLKVIR